MRYMMRSSLITMMLMLAFHSPSWAVVELKIATVAPDGSAWMRIFNKMKAKIKTETNGSVELRFYPGQVQGDERDVVRKINTGQLQGGSFTAVGLGMINPKSLVLQMPMIFSNYAQLDKVRQALQTDFEQSFREKGYELLGWGDVGWVYLFTQNEIKNMSELRQQKVWVWGDDPLSKALMKEMNVSPRMLGLPQVYPALNTGMINAVYNAPLACLTLQWHTKVKYFLDYPLAIAIGATVVSKKAFDKISPEHQAAIKSITQQYHHALNLRVRKDNDKALAALKKQGLIPIPVPENYKKEFMQAATKVAHGFAPRYYPKALLEKVLQLR